MPPPTSAEGAEPGLRPKRRRVEEASGAQTVGGSSRQRRVAEAAQPTTDRVVAFNVGGTIVTTLESTLRSTPSHLTAMLDSNFRGLPRDAAGRPFLDCDATNFKYVLNYLRGYGLPAKADDLVMLAEDAVRFDIETLQRDMGVKAPEVWKFNVGPGVAPDGLQFSTADTLALCGANALSPVLAHSITFKVDKCDAVAVGVMGFDTAREDQQIFDQRHSVCYRSSGEMVRYLSDEPLFCSGASYANSSLVTVRIRFMPAGCTNATLPPLLRAAPPPPAEGATTSAVPVGGPGASGAAPQSPQPPLAGFTPANLVEANQQLLQQQQPVAPSTLPPLIPPPRSRQQQSEVQSAPSFAAGDDAASGAPNVPTSRAGRVSPGELSPLSEASPQAAEASATFFPSPLSLPDVPIGAVILFLKDDEPQFEARWPVPVPPLQFAVSLQGNSSVTIVDAFSSDDHDERWEGPRQPQAQSRSGAQTPAHLDTTRLQTPQGLTVLQLPPGMDNVGTVARDPQGPPPPPSSSR